MQARKKDTAPYFFIWAFLINIYNCVSSLSSTALLSTVTLHLSQIHARKKFHSSLLIAVGLEELYEGEAGVSIE